MTEQHTIHLPVIRYRDKAGNPTCAVDFETGDVCQFYRTQRLGTGKPASLPKRAHTQSLPTTWSAAMASRVRAWAL